MIDPPVPRGRVWHAYSSNKDASRGKGRKETTKQQMDATSDGSGLPGDGTEQGSGHVGPTRQQRRASFRQTGSRERSRRGSMSTGDSDFPLPVRRGSMDFAASGVLAGARRGSIGEGGLVASLAARRRSVNDSLDAALNNRRGSIDSSSGLARTLSNRRNSFVGSDTLDALGYGRKSIDASAPGMAPSTGESSSGR